MDALIFGYKTLNKTINLLFATNKGADQPAHPRSLISVFVISNCKV